MSETIARPPAVWQESVAKTVTFMVTEDCQLRCGYCYFSGKNSHGRMPFEIAAKSVDYLLFHPEIFNEKAVVWDFIGGEPFLEIDLVDRICDYITERQEALEHPWKENFRFSFTTNGILYGSEKVQAFIRKNLPNLSIGVTIDGTPEKHDMHRIYPSGKGSYADTASNIPLWLSQFPGGSTKVTVSSPDIPFIAESVLHLYSMGIRHVSINVVFEDVWKKGDDRLFEEQLVALADRIVEQGLYREHTCSFFSETIGQPLIDSHNWCGAGRMLAIDGRGNFYPCHRFTPPSLGNRQAISLGNCFDGLNSNRLRPFLSLDRFSQSPGECMRCEIASGCAWCQAVNYDTAASPTVFERATFLCGMHKARVRANNHYLYKLEKALSCSA
ncbi:MAG: radical SAM peptide maturase, CXXX-repeat target family [Chlorobiaceae bacterium]|nr:radical SAM peptide maturase, CXXX-repeat target family [Chlorobiaceae bacterium]NTV60343.1 radical SAM peptide maturase, CXXX-repeat target family [Chlorobiaceae bacterium]